MFFKKRNKLLLSFCLLIGCLNLSSCSAFFGGDEGYLISDLSTTTDSEGNTIVTITFDNEDIAPVVFTIPKGLSGDPGVGIKSITPSLNSEGNEVTLTITYTDSSLEPTVLTIPVISGENGVGISNVIVGKDEIGNTTLQFEYSDGSTSEIITINKGEDGVGIDHIDQREDLMNERIVITIYYSNGETQELYIPRGEDGVSIVNVETSETINTYELTITFSNGTSTVLSLNKPVATRWYSGNGLPQIDLGNEGDFYLNEADSRNVYKKINGTWQFLFSLSGTGSTTRYEVTFNTNGGSWRYIDSTDESSINKDKVIVVTEGSYINLNDDMYSVYKEGFTFNGWWTDKELNVNSGHLTLLTPIFSDLTLYANWISE